MKKIVTLGPEGSFSSSVAKSYFCLDEHTIEYKDTFHGLQMLKNRKVDAAVYPIENNLGGFVNDTFFAIYRTSNIVIDTVKQVPIIQNLIANNNNVAKIEEIHSHPQAIAQCKRNIEKIEKQYNKKFRIIKCSSTAEAIVSARNNPKIAAIGSALGAAQYDVPIIKSEFQDKRHNVTRFAVLKQGSLNPEKKRSMYSMYLVEFFSLSEGFSILSGFLRALNINLISLNPYPVYSATQTMCYAYFMEISGSKYNDPSVAALHKALINRRLHALKRARWIGSYEMV